MSPRLRVSAGDSLPQPVDPLVLVRDIQASHGFHLDRRQAAARDDSGRWTSPIFIPVERSKEPMLFGLKPEGLGLHAGSPPLEGISRSLEAEEHVLEVGEVGVYGEEQASKAEEQASKREGQVHGPWRPILLGELA